MEEVTNPDTQTNTISKTNSITKSNSITKTNTKTRTIPNPIIRTNSNPKIPSGQVSCLLCRGFISVLDGDRARFVDHMNSEHEVKHDREVILAVSVLTEREKQFLIKSTADRLDAMGKGKSPDLSKSIFDPTQSAPPQVVPMPVGPTTTPARLRGSVPIQQRPMRPQQRLMRPQAPPAVIPPRMLGNNSSISISKVDMSRPCNMCKVMLPSPDALAEHMTKNHFSRLAGINIQMGDSSAKSSSFKPTPVKIEQPVVKRTPQSTTPQAKMSPGQARNITMAKAKAIASQKGLTNSPTSNAFSHQVNQNSPSSQNKMMANSPLQPRPQGVTMERSPIVNGTPQQIRSNPPVRTPSQPPSKIARMAQMNGISLTPTGASAKNISEEASKDNCGEQNSEKTIQKEVEGLQTLELLDNLVNFLESDS